jgi:hypothetical protein
MRQKRKAETEIFICDKCGTRTRLSSAVRHWCSNCNVGSPVEMRSVRDKRKLVGEENPTSRH